eukprot:CAMPEP_0183351132 /NCGR_PEP_ID=MMETSP0164_2-20130417/23384_1 /TAXON_ID=221442 /ORGANISM="Coccolithus pelagicus ssp braarudi, Strain PLY182g" /LENGTH=160 /DNA_ID=CAMNT_0025523241 /DNA_START=68 /DNA_END=550 /DNA_ORIENTATION=+
MLVPKKNRRAVFSYLFKEGVLVCKKDVFLAKHQQLEVPNVQVMKLMQSLKSRGYVNEKFSWQWFYYSLTNEGIEYLRDYLHVPADVLPDTLAKPQKPQRPPSFGAVQSDRPRRSGYGDRDAYRGKKTGAGDDFNPEFGRGRGGFRGGRGGFRGRGRGRGM